MHVRVRLAVSCWLCAVAGACSTPAPVAHPDASATATDTTAAETTDTTIGPCTDDKQCADDTACTFDLCNLEGKCEHKPTATACDDGNACTEGDTCKLGACSPGATKNCQDTLPCTSDACDPKTGCTHTASTAPCDDGNPCTVGDVCADSACSGGTQSPCDDNNACTSDSCSGPKVMCAHLPVDSTTCDAKAWPQLAIRVHDSAGDWVAVTAGNVLFAGTVLGLADEVTWSTSYAKTGTATLDLPHFSAVVPVAPGDNLISFMAHAGTETAQHTITAVYAPVPVFEGPLRVSAADNALAGKNTLRFEVAVAQIEGGTIGKMEVHAVTAQGVAQKLLGELQDSGGPCDVQAGDGRYSACFDGADSKPGAYWFRAAATLKGPTMPTGTIWSLPTQLDVLPPWPSALCGEQLQLVETSAAKWALLAQKQTPSAATTQLLAELAASPLVAQAGSADGGVWIRFANGVLGIAVEPAKGVRGPASPDTYAQLLRAESIAAADEGQTLQAIVAPGYCGPWGDAPLGNQAAMEKARQLGRYGLGVWVGHGGVAFGGMAQAAWQAYQWHHRGPQEYLMVAANMQCEVGNPAVPDAAAAYERYPGPESYPLQPSTVQALAASPWLAGDLLAGRVALAPGGRLAVLPAFWQRHARFLPRSVVYIGTCSSMGNGSLALELLAAGASAVVGYSGTVADPWATAKGTDWVNAMAAGKSAGLATTKQTDPAHPLTRMRLLGDPQAGSGGGQLNGGGFESATLQGWAHPRWMRAATHLGPNTAASGGHMLMLATGNGPGAIQQTACVPPGGQLCVDWRYFSAEPAAGCSDFDAFTLQLAVPGAQLKTLLKVTPNALCAPTECPACGGAVFSPKIPAQLQTGSGPMLADAFETGWQNSCFDVAAYAGLRVRVTLGLASYPPLESVVLVDNVTLQ